jgi:hypothetical protein
VAPPLCPPFFLQWGYLTGAKLVVGRPPHRVATIVTGAPPLRRATPFFLHRGYPSGAKIVLGHPVWIGGPEGGSTSPQGRPKDYERALTACSIRSIPFSMFFMDMA